MLISVSAQKVVLEGQPFAIYRKRIVNVQTKPWKPKNIDMDKMSELI